MPDERLTFFSALYGIPKSLATKNTEELEQTKASTDKNSDVEDSETSWTTVCNAPMNCHFQIAYNHIHHGRRKCLFIIHLGSVCMQRHAVESSSQH